MPLGHHVPDAAHCSDYRVSSSLLRRNHAVRPTPVTFAIPAGQVVTHQIGHLVVGRTPTFNFLNLQVISNGSLMHVLPETSSGGSSPTYNVYYNSNPNQSFSNPGSFSQGQLIASFNSVKWMATLSPNGG